MTPDYRTVVESLTREGVEFVVIGGVAMVLRGRRASPRTSTSVTGVRAPGNLEALARALAPFHPSLRGTSLFCSMRER